jgi:hypothetical protein
MDALHPTRRWAGGPPLRSPTQQTRGLDQYGDKSSLFVIGTFSARYMLVIGSARLGVGSGSARRRLDISSTLARRQISVSLL